MSFERSAGILMPISSLPSPYGIGTLGKTAYDFVDFLVKADQSYWQVLPIGPTSYGDSPYQSFSSAAGNPYFIDLDMLAQDGLIDKNDLKNIKVDDPNCIDYGFLYETRYKLLTKAYRNGIEKYRDDFYKYAYENGSWLHNYALFMAVKGYFDMKSWLEWPDQDIRFRRPEAMEKYSEMLHEEIEFYKFLQYLFHRQYSALRQYANNKGIKIIGDLPIYIAMDSCEIWAEPDQFQLNEADLMPSDVSGVPPDYFSKTGQLWGNPLYNWEKMKENGYRWWIERIDRVSKYFDVIRIDHFRGFEEYWSIPYGEKTAVKGKWVKGPSSDFVNVIKNWFSNVDFIAEDLGIIDEKVTALLVESGFPGMRVLEFGMADDGTSYHCPHNHVRNCVCYVSTHDNTPIMGWIRSAKKKDLEYARLYYGLNEEEGYNIGFIRGGMSSVCDLFICQIQDWLGLEKEATINNPGTMGNWKWRIDKKMLNDRLARKIAKMTYSFDRGRPENKKKETKTEKKKENSEKSAE